MLAKEKSFISMYQNIQKLHLNSLNKHLTHGRQSYWKYLRYEKYLLVLYFKVMS